MSIFNKVKIIVTFIFTIWVNINFSQALYLNTADSSRCGNSSIQCLSNSTYRTCVNAGSFTILLNTQLTCPDGYICDESALSYPCTNAVKTTIADAATTASTTTASTTTVDSTTTVQLTTTSTTSTQSSATTQSATTKASRPSNAPECTDTGLWPAAECNQYYECVKVRNFLFGYRYEAVLRSCDSGENFDTTILACVSAAESDC